MYMYMYMYDDDEDCYNMYMYMNRYTCICTNICSNSKIMARVMIDREKLEKINYKPGL